MHKGSFTIEAAIYVPMVLFLIMYVLTSGIFFFQEARLREMPEDIAELDIVQEFYVYQAIGEIWGELADD